MKIHFNPTVRLFTGCLLLLSCAAGSLLAQNNNMGIGTSTPDVSAILEVKSTTKGLLIPRMEPNIFPTATSTGLLFYNKGDKVLNYWDGIWRPVGLWKLNTTGEKAYYSAGNVGIGTTDPDRPLTVQGVGANMDLFSLKNSSGATKWHLNMYDGSGLNFSETGVADGRLFLKAGGNVGIGTINPQDDLSVIGTVRGAADVTETDYTEMGHGGANGFINTVGDGNLDFRHNSTTLMSLTEAGNVGIGNNAPDYKLTIGGGNEVIALDNTATMVAKNSSGTYQAFLWPRWSDNVMYMNYGTAGFNIRNNASTSTMFMTNGGQVGINGDPGSYRLSVKHEFFGLRLQNTSQGANYWELWHSDDINRFKFYNTNDEVAYIDYDDGGYHSTSDRRLKDNIITLNAVLPSLLQLQAKSYTYKSDKDKKERIGFIAQEVEKLFPQLVTPPTASEKGEGHYFMNYAGFGILAIKAIQEQQAVIETQAAKIEAQQAELDAIKKALAKAGIKLD